ncbi:hypothetical protein M0R45_026109 [Rubus argutus]|uniref:TIR domain-containing protein n=1 Tax=Rubus argutus TaxID=59490 RepID=A0AAW1WYC9_RUBAR
MDTNLQVGDAISPTLLKSIEESRFAIVILSPNYASSTWCLQEIAKICRSMEYNDRILPLFFNVEPDDVLLFKGSFEEAFTKYENDGLYRSEKLQEWKDALTKVANCKGWNSKNYKTERELVNKIVEDMCSKVQPNENNKGDLEATREAKKKAHLASGVYVSGGTISGSNVNLGEQGDVVSNVGGDFIKGVAGNFIKGGPKGDIIRGDRGGDGGNSYGGGYAGAGGPAKGNNTFNYGQK